MAWGSVVTCNSCSLRQELLTGLHSCYRLSEGANVPVYERVAWCHSCGEVVVAEDLLTEEEIERELERANAEEPFDLDLWHKANLARLYENPTDFDPSRDKVRHEVVNMLGWAFQKITRSEYTTTLIRMLRWCRGRLAAPRCLRCGSSAIQYLETDTNDEESWGWLTHPECGGTLRVVCNAHVSLVGAQDAYSSEGIALSPEPD